MRGRKPKPTAVKILEGNPGHRPLNASEPKFSRMRAACPKWLGKVGRETWRSLTKTLGSVPDLVTQADVAMLGQLCWWVQRFHELRVRLESPDEDGKQKDFRLDLQINRAQAHISTLAARFGLTPADRVRLQMPSSFGDFGEDADEYDQMLRERDGRGLRTVG